MELYTTLVYVGLGLSGLIWLVSTTSRFALLRCVPCFNRTPGFANEVVIKVLEKVIMIVLTMVLTNLRFSLFVPFGKYITQDSFWT
jgi:hypothetical protein